MDSKFNNINFQKDGLVSATSRINEKGETIIYWTDGVNPPRFYNIDTDEGFTLPDELNIFPFIDKPAFITLDKVMDSGGSVISGSHQFAIRYVDSEDNTTNFTSISKPIDTIRFTQRGFANGFYSQGNPVNLTGKSIKLSITNIDTNYEFIQIAVIRYEDGGVADVMLIPPLSITDTTMEYIYSGGEDTIDGSIEEILIDNAHYDSAKSITQVDNTLYLGNLEKKPEFNFQRYANSITVECITKTLSQADKYQWAYGDETLTFFNKSFRREEVYAFYISFVLDNGQETKAFHIPGRPPDVINAGTSLNEDTSISSPLGVHKYFHLYSPAKTNQMSYWENQSETYPDTDDWDIIGIDSLGEQQYGTLRNKNVRHHKFPGYQDKPVVKGLSNNGENATVDILGIRIKDLVIPDELRSKVRGIRLYAAEKDDSDKLVLDQGWTIGVAKPIEEDLYYNNLIHSTTPGSPDVRDQSIFATVPFSSMVRNNSLAGTTYIKTNTLAINTKVEQYTSSQYDNESRQTRHILQQTPLTYDYGNIDPDFIRGVKAIARIPSNLDLVTITNLGFTYDKNSIKSESNILIELDSDINLTRSSNVDEINGKMVSLCQLKKEVYAPFDLQALRLMGSYFGDIEVFSPAYLEQGSNDFAQGSITLNSGAPTAGTGSWANVIITLDNGDTLSYDIQYGDSRETIVNALGASYSGTDYSISYSQVYNVDTQTTENYQIVLTSNNTGAAYNSQISSNSLNFDSISTLNDITGGESAGATIDVFGGDTYINKFGYRIGEIDLMSNTTDHAVHHIFNIVESYDNIAFRQAGNDYGELNGNDYSRSRELVELEVNDPGENPDVFYDNYFTYDLSHSVSGALAVKTTPFPKNFSEVTQFPNRIIRSRTDDDVLESDLFRVFLAEDYIDMPKNRGEITNLKVLQNILIAHMRRGLFKTRGREELVTADFRAFLGNGNIFAIKPDELFSVEEGYAGLQNARSSVVTPMGYFFVDQQARKVFSVAGKPVEISEAGMRNFFEDNLPWNINELEDGIADKLIKPEIIMAYDPEYKRVLLIKKDWTPTTALKNANWSVVDGELLVDGTAIDWNNETYLLDESFTISYLPEIQRWASFHSYKPDYMYNDINKMYSVKGGDVYNHKGNPANFYGTKEDMIYEFVNNEEPEQTKLVRNVEFITYAYDVGSPDRVNYKKTFDAIRISNELQDTGYVDLIYFTEPNGNLRNSGHTWKANKFRDVINPDTGEVDQSLPFHRKKKLTGKYAIVRLYYTPADARFLRLISSDVNFRKHAR